MPISNKHGVKWFSPQRKLREKSKSTGLANQISRLANQLSHVHDLSNTDSLCLASVRRDSSCWRRLEFERLRQRTAKHVQTAPACCPAAAPANTVSTADCVAEDGEEAHFRRARTRSTCETARSNPCTFAAALVAATPHLHHVSAFSQRQQNAK